MVREVAIGAGDRFAARQVLGLDGVAIRRQDELRLGPGRRRAGPQRSEGLRDLAGGGDGDMEVVGLKDSAQVGPVRLALAQALDCRLLVAEGLKEGEWKLLSVEGLLSQRGNCLFDLDRVQLLALPFAWIAAAFLVVRGVNSIITSAATALFPD